MHYSIVHACTDCTVCLYKKTPKKTHPRRGGALGVQPRTHSEGVGAHSLGVVGRHSKDHSLLCGVIDSRHVHFVSEAHAETGAGKQGGVYQGIDTPAARKRVFELELRLQGPEDVEDTCRTRSADPLYPVNRQLNVGRSQRHGPRYRNLHPEILKKSVA